MTEDNKHKLADLLESAIKIRMKDNESWLADIALPKVEFTDRTLSKILQIAKTKISRDYNIPIDKLLYRELVNKDLISQNPSITALFVKYNPELGEIRISFSPGKSESGEKYDDMLLYLDLYPTKQKWKSISLSEVEKLLLKEKMNLHIVDIKAVEAGVKYVNTFLKPQRNILIAKGEYPDPVKDAEVHFFCELKELEKNKFTSLDKAELNSIICWKIPMVRWKKMGQDVRGKKIAPEQARDIYLESGKNVSMSSNYLEVNAIVDGIMKMRMEDVEDPDIKHRVIVSVEAVEAVDGRKLISSATDKPIEIKNGLRSNSSIISRSTVIVSGDVENGATITTTGDIVISGNITGGSLSGAGDFNGKQNIISSKLTAGGKLKVSGKVVNSEIAAEEVVLKEVTGSSITAGSKIEIDSIADGDGMPTVLRTNPVSFKQELIKDNQKYIDNSEKNLKKIKNTLGENIISEADSTNISRIILNHIRELRKKGIDVMEGEVEALRQIIASVRPMTGLMQEKRKAIRALEKEIERITIKDSTIVIKKAMNSPVKIDMGDFSEEIVLGEKGIILHYKDGNITKEDYK